MVIFKNQQIQSQILFYIFLVLSISDYLDGFSKKVKYYIKFWKVFDPISDKILTSSALLFLSSIDNMVLLPSILIIFREFLISGIREFSLIKNNKNVNVSNYLKLKTTLQFFIISFLLILYSSHNRYFLMKI